MLILGVDPGLTRCGLGLVEAGAARSVRLVDVRVAETPAGDPVPARLASVAAAVESLLDQHEVAAVALERVFSQHNVRTVMGTAQVSGVVMLAAERRGLPVALYTPSEVKAAVTGSGRATKPQVTVAVQRILGLAEAPRPADAADALAIAVAHAWRAAAGALDPAKAATASDARTPAQRRWAAAEAATRHTRR